MSTKFNLDLPNHAAEKTTRALNDVLQLTDDPGERLRIALMAAGHMIGIAGGTLHALMLRDGQNPTEREAREAMFDLLRACAVDGADAAWRSLGGKVKGNRR